MRDVPAHIRRYARAMRRSMTPEERRIWHDFLSCSPYHFRRQYPVGGYIADFYSHCLRLVIEIDGGQHFEQDGWTYDMKRTAYMQARQLRLMKAGVCYEWMRHPPSARIARHFPRSDGGS